MTGLHIDGTQWSQGLPGATPAKVCEIELSEPIRSIHMPGYRWAYILVRMLGSPVGWLTCRVTNGSCLATDIRRSVARELTPSVLAAWVRELLLVPPTQGGLDASKIFHASEPDSSAVAKITVAICTRDRPQQLSRCLESVSLLSPAAAEVIVVDNASRDNATWELVTSKFSRYKYVREDRPGLNWARNAAWKSATNDIVAFVDDDAVVDRQWIAAISDGFRKHDVSALTGLIAPLELETESQLHFELIGGFGRGFAKSWYRIDPREPEPDVFHLGAGRFGAGTNMAFRVPALRQIGGFDPALDVGTGTEGGGDLDAFLRLLHEGHTLVYDPAALVWHGHRSDAPSLNRQIATWGTATTAVLASSFRRYPHFRARILRFGLVWSWRGYFGPFVRSLLGPGRVPRMLRARPLTRLLKGPWRYIESKAQARSQGDELGSCWEPTGRAPRLRKFRDVELVEPIKGIEADPECSQWTLRVTFARRWVGVVSIESRGHAVSASEIRAKVGEELADKVVTLGLPQGILENFDSLSELVRDALRAEDDGPPCEFIPQLASIVIATRNRPEQLRRCLASILAQDAPFQFEVVVVDNAPGSGLTRSALPDDKRIRYVVEPVQGLSQARNTGFRAARGDILVATDDDVVVPAGWLQELVQPFRFAHVGISTGQVLPLSLNHSAQRSFEALGGLGKGTRSFEVGPEWFASSTCWPPRAWDLGATANAAFRRATLQDRRVGLLAEFLGPGTPAGGGEDAYVFYRALKAGYTVYYEADAVLYHEHRAEDAKLRRQMFDYARGHVSYLLTTAAFDQDWRALCRLLVTLPAWHLLRLVVPLQRDASRPLVLWEIAGYICGPVGWVLALIRSHRHTRGGRVAASEGLPCAYHGSPATAGQEEAP